MGAGRAVVEVVLSVYVTQTKYNSLQMQPRSLFRTELLEQQRMGRKYQETSFSITPEILNIDSIYIYIYLQ